MAVSVFDEKLTVQRSQIFKAEVQLLRHSLEELLLKWAN